MHLIGGPNITIDRASFTPGPHTLSVTIRTDSGQSTTSQLGFQGNDEFVPLTSCNADL